MDTSVIRWQYHLVSAVLVMGLLAGYQYWRTTLDWRFLVGVGIAYVLISVAIDLGRGSGAES